MGPEGKQRDYGGPQTEKSPLLAKEGKQRDYGGPHQTEKSPLLAKSKQKRKAKLPHPKYQAASITYDSDCEATAIINNSDLLTSYYEMRDIRVPEAMFGLDFYYCFYLFIGVRIGAVEEDKHRLITGVEEIDNDNEEMMKVGAAPSPHTRQPFLWIFQLFTNQVQTMINCLSILSLIFYASVHLAQASRTEFPMLRSLFVIFEMCAVVASLALASEILTKRLIGTRIFYTLHSYANKTLRRTLKHQMGWALGVCVGINFLLPAVGILDDLVITKNQPSVDDLYFLADFHIVLVPLWEICSVIVNLQLVSGVTVFAGISAIYLVRMNSVVKLLKQPNTKMRDCFAELFDLDVALSDLSNLLDFRLSVMLISAFLTFFFQSIFLSNSGVDFSEGINAFLSFLHPALICFFILGTTGALNANSKRLKLVAYRFGVFKEKLFLDRARKEKKEKSRKAKAKKLAENAGDSRKTVGKSGGNAEKSGNDAEKSGGNDAETSGGNDVEKSADESPQEPNPTLVDLIERDEATVGDEDLFEKELEALKGYLQDSTIGISLLGFQLDESFTWGFLVLTMSSVMSLTNLDKLSFL